MATLNITNIPAPRVPFIDERTGLMAREWYRFFLNLFVLTGSGNNPTTLEELQLGPPNQPDLAELLIQVNQNIAPQYEDQSGDFLATLDTAQLMSMMARFENLEAAIQGAYLGPPSVPTDGVYVPYNNATTNVDLNNKHIVNVAHIGVGTSSTPDTLILAVGDNGSLSRIVMRGYSANASSSSMRVSKYRGTVAAPQVPQSGDSLGQFQFAGYATTSADGSAGAYWEGVTTETWGATANGTKVLLKVTPNTTTTPVTAVTIDQDKSVTFATTASATTFIGALTGTVGATTPTTGAFTTLSATNTSSTAVLNLIQDGTTASVLNLYSYRAGGNRAQFTGLSARGSLASPSDVLNDDSLIFLLGSAYAGGAFRNVVAIYLSVESTGTISATSCPTNITFLTTPNGSITRAERMRIFSSGGVSIGNTTDPGATNLSVTGTANVASTTDATSTTSAALITAGGLAVAKKVYTGDNVVPAAAKGVNFTGNTPAAGMTSQLMNWYEEGTWTPVMSFTTNGDLAVTYSAQVGHYERVGSQVTARFRVVASAFTYTTATGTFQITGLPFTSNSTTNFIGVGPVYINNVLMTAVSATATYSTARVSAGTSIINIIISGNNSAANTANQASMPSGNLVGFTGLVTYRV